MWRTACAACQRLQGEIICENCWQQLTPLLPEQGRLQLKVGQTHVLPHVAYTAYASPLKNWLFAIKYESQKKMARSLGKYLGRWFKSQWPCPDYLVPVPLHAHRFQERGYNQSHEIALGLSQVLHVPVSPLVKRCKDTPALYRLSPHERQEALSQAFALAHGEVKHCQGARLLLVDDIFTTGSTLSSIAEALLPISERLVSISLALTLPE